MSFGLTYLNHDGKWYSPLFPKPEKFYYDQGTYGSRRGVGKQWRGSCNLIGQHFRERTRI